MIYAESYVRLEMDDAGREKIEAAVETVGEIIQALQKAGGMTTTIADTLTEARVCMLDMLQGTLY